MSQVSDNVMKPFIFYEKGQEPKEDATPVAVAPVAVTQPEQQSTIKKVVDKLTKHKVK